MNTPYFEYYISVYNKCGLFLAYGKKMSIDTFTMDGVNMISDNDPNYQIQDLLITDNVLDDAGFYKLSTSRYNIPALSNDLFFHIPVTGIKYVEVLKRAERYYYVKPNHPSVALKPVASVSEIQTEAYNECSDLVLPLLKTIINRQKLYFYITGHTHGRYVIETKKIDDDGKVKLTTTDYNYLLLEPVVVNAFPVIEIKILTPQCVSVDIHTTIQVHCISTNSWDDVIKANPQIQTLPTSEADQIHEAYQLVHDAVAYCKTC